MRAGTLDPGAIADLSRSAQVEQGRHAVAHEIQRLARQKAPSVTGTLIRSISVEDVVVAGVTESHIGWDPRIADYGPDVEFGTEDTPAEPHLRPAADEVNNRRA